MFVKFIAEYQLQEMDRRMKWDADAIVKFAQQKDMSLRRKVNSNLLKSCQMAIQHIKENESGSDSEDSQAEDDIPIPGNAMNNSLLGIYKNSTEPAKVEPETPVTKETPKRKRGAQKDAAKKPKVEDSQKWPTPTTKLNDLMQLIGMPLKHPEIYRHLGIDPPRGILLHGPPGCGKTLLANAIAGEMGVPFISIAAPVIVSGMSGESEKKIREVFEEAKQLAPCILFIDEIDAITPKRETAQREMERRIVAQLLTCMDDVSLEKTDYKPVMIIGATNRPDALYLLLT
jgi:ribosome biogenesis ATPase